MHIKQTHLQAKKWKLPSLIFISIELFALFSHCVSNSSSEVVGSEEIGSKELGLRKLLEDNASALTVWEKDLSKTLFYR